MTTPRRPPLAEQLDLVPHPEGGWYRQTWRSAIEADFPGYRGPRAVATAIYFLLHPGEESRWHTVRSDELWLWHRGGRLALRLAGSGDAPGADVVEMALGPRVEAHYRPQAVVPGGVWQSAAPMDDEPVLVTCVVAPGFDMADFRMI
ncbi:cupin domain-containing protein [Planosporangium flavigriseum]|uniref:Cupin n=1 Tax=Planosporangium flavigriseum TaxID=373681 RepID=A0A8J3LND5_9ACTN|nr:cupin domain-containing protein [Planosporangium flavigriseum]NJC67840.1 cupin domain-containing protein [Planosporangium flavigriseum]GIG76343.1 cupin [Planosporangium flavigriseum]